MQGVVLQVNTSPGGIPKWPVPAASLTVFGLEGDAYAHPGIHGSPEQAVLIVCAETVERLIDRGYPLFYGGLGENLTTRGLDPRFLRSGQRYRIGTEAVIELTRVRRPCATLDVYGPSIESEIFDSAVKAGDTTSPRWALSGFYARVVQPGLIRAGDPIILLDELA
jgi:MOSC domain-containing protein YiiM